MAGKMRRLIEAVVNTHVFNHQRHQYKQRKHSVSEFHHYTKLVPLETAEATTLRDLYAKRQSPNTTTLGTPTSTPTRQRFRVDTVPSLPWKTR